MANTRFRPRRRSTSWRVPTTLAALSLAAILLPASMTQHAASFAQLFVPFQDAVCRAADIAAGTLTSAGVDHTRDSERELHALRSTIVSLAAQNQWLRGENETLTGVRGRGLGNRGRLIPGRVVADDPLPWRDSRLLLGGLRRGISRGDGVMSRHFSVDLGDADGARTGLAVLGAEILVGVIDQVGSYTSRVKLLSDPATRMSVTVGRMGETSFSRVEASFWLVGGGHGRIEVREVDHRYVTDGRIKTGDVVLTREDDPFLPPLVTIGVIHRITVDPENGLLYVLTVHQPLRIDELRRTYVVDTQS